MPHALNQGMKAEMAFLKYRREVVQAWPVSPRRAVFLAAIESRIFNLQRESQAVPYAAMDLLDSSRLGMNVPDWNETSLNQYTPFTRPPSTAMHAPVM